MIDEFEAHVDEEGRIILPAGFAKLHGLIPGSKIPIQRNHDDLHLRLPAKNLAKIYIEPTNHCNLSCVTCIRNGWEEPLGEMADSTFGRILEDLRSLPSPPDFFFGGLGEPLSHPNIVEMITAAKSLGSSVELITNGTLLNESLAVRLIDAGLDMLWVSLDGATPESYTDVRLGAALPEVLVNLAVFRKARWKRRPLAREYWLRPRLGIVFVAMRRNIAELPAVMRLGMRLGATRFMVSNVLPYTSEMQDERLYTRVLENAAYTDSRPRFTLELPRIDIDATTHEALFQVMRDSQRTGFTERLLGQRRNRCPFVEKGTISIRWDGDASPCLALLHNHKTYLYAFERSIRHYAVGNVTHQSLRDLWQTPEYLAFRDRVRKFDFSPCPLCGGCELLNSNDEDCFGSLFPACGGCLWAQGVIQCP